MRNSVVTFLKNTLTLNRFNVKWDSHKTQQWSQYEKRKN